MSGTDVYTSSGTNGQPSRLSYKFQRLREQIRTAILSGEFQGRLPGERELGRRYNANAKTINKALCDLSSEGLLVRHIGRGTFVAKDLEGTVQARKVFRCFRFDSMADVPYRELVGGLREAEVTGGCDLQEIRVRSAQGSGVVQLSDWAPTLRRSTDGLFFVPNGPLSGGSCQLSEALVMEAHRRHVPIVSLGACANSPKLNAVVPDYVDAGYRLSEHVYRLGCEMVIAAYQCSGREVEAVLSGCRTAATRYQGRFSESMLDGDGGQGAVARLEKMFEEAVASPRQNPLGPAVGIVCIGSAAVRAVQASQTLVQRWRRGEIAVTSVLDAGDTMARDFEITSYDVESERIASWAARLMAESHPGQRPVEIVIPGVLNIRNSIAQEALSHGVEATPQAPMTTSSSDSVLVETTI